MLRKNKNNDKKEKPCTQKLKWQKLIQEFMKRGKLKQGALLHVHYYLFIIIIYLFIYYLFILFMFL